MLNVQWSMSLKSHSLLSLVGSGINSLTSLLLGSVLHFLGLVGSGVSSILGSFLDSITGSADG